MDVWRVWHFLLLLTLVEAPASPSVAEAAHVLKRRRQSSAAPVTDQGRLNAWEGVILRVAW